MYVHILVFMHKYGMASCDKLPGVMLRVAQIKTFKKRRRGNQIIGN